MKDDFDKRDFFAWCSERGLDRPEDIASYFRLSGQTIRNWKKDIDSGEVERLELAYWVRLAVGFYEKTAGGKGCPERFDQPDMSFSTLKAWQNRHGFKTYEATADIFQIKRQAVHLWHKRQKIPAWVALACAGYDCSIQSK